MRAWARAPFRNDVSHGDGVYKSTDRGRTWVHLGLADTRHISEFRIHPRDSDRVYVAALGHAFGPNSERGVYRSTDGGASWERVLYKDDRTGAADLALDVRNPTVLYASLWETHRNFWELASGGPGRAGCGGRPIRGPPGPRSLRTSAFPPRPSSARSAWPRHPPAPAGYGRWSNRTPNPASTAQTTSATPGRSRATARISATAPGTTCTCSRTRRTRTPSTSTTCGCGSPPTPAHTSHRCPPPTATTTICGSTRATTGA